MSTTDPSGARDRRARQSTSQRKVWNYTPELPIKMAP